MAVPLDSAEVSVLIYPRNDSRLPEIHTDTMDYPWRIRIPQLIEGVCSMDRRMRVEIWIPWISGLGSMDSTDCRLGIMDSTGLVGEYGVHGLTYLGKVNHALILQL